METTETVRDSKPQFFTELVVLIAIVLLLLVIGFTSYHKDNHENKGSGLEESW